MNNLLFPLFVKQKSKGKVKTKKGKKQNLSFFQLANQVSKQVDGLIRGVSDFDGDGVLNWKDCQPLNRKKQHREEVTYKDAESIRESLKRGKEVSDLSYPEFVIFMKSRAKEEPFIKVVRGFGIYKGSNFQDGGFLYHALDIKTGIITLSNRESLGEIVEDIKTGVPEQLRRENPEMHTLRGVYSLIKRHSVKEKKYGGRSKTFKKYGGQKVLDIGAGGTPDLRATHAIDLVRPMETYPNLDYKWGYDFNKETTNLPYSSNSFDVVVSLGSLGRNFESANIYREIYRVLKPGGRFEYSEPWHPDSISHLKKAGFGKLQKKTYFNEYLNERIPLVVARKG